MMKIILLIIAVGLVGFVLYLGYQFDKDEEKKRRKEKFGKSNLYNSDIEKKVSSFYNPKKDKHRETALQRIKNKRN